MKHAMLWGGFSGQNKYYGMFSTVISTTFWSFFVSRITDLTEIAFSWLNGKCSVILLNDKVDTQTHVHSHWWCCFVLELTCSLRLFQWIVHSLLLSFNMFLIFWCFYYSNINWIIINHLCFMPLGIGLVCNSSYFIMIEHYFVF